MAILDLQIEVKQGGSSGKQDVTEIETIMNRFQPNIEMMPELRDKVGPMLELSDDAHTEDSEPYLTKEELQQTVKTTQSSWNVLKTMLDEVKGIFASAQARREILTHMENVLAEIEEIGLGIDKFQEERLRQSQDTGRPTSTPSSPPFSLSTSSLDANIEDSQNKSRKNEALTNLDARIETLAPKIKSLTTQIDELPSIDIKSSEVQDQYQELLTLWDETKTRREKIGEELKEERWLAVFEQVAKQIESMMESMDRAIDHCKGLVDQIKLMVKQKEVPALPIDREHLYTIFKGFEAKHKYYAPAVNKMLNMLENGIESRTAKNNEAIEKHKAMKARWGQLQDRLDRVELDLDGIEEMLDILDASIPSQIPTPPTQLPEKPMFSMRRSQIQPEWKSPGPLNLFQPPEQDQQPQRGRRPFSHSTNLHSPTQFPKETPKVPRSRSPLNTKTRQRPWSPAPSISSQTSMLSPNLSSNFRSISPSPSRKPSYPTSDKPRPWCPSTKTSSPSIPGIPYSPSAAATYTPRSKSTTRDVREPSPTPPMPPRSGTAMSKMRSASCTPTIGRESSLPRPVFSPTGSLSKLSSGALAPRSTSPAPRSTSPAPRPTSPAPASSSGRKSQARLPPPVNTNPSSRMRQNSAPNTPTPQQRRSSSSMSFNRDPLPSTIALQPSSKQRAFSPPSSTRQRQPSGQNIRSISQMGYNRDQENNGIQRNRRSSFGSTTQSSGVVTTTHRSNTNSVYGSGPFSASRSAPSVGLEGSNAEEPTSPSASSSSSVNSFNRLQPQSEQQEQQKSHKSSTVDPLQNRKTDIDFIAPYMPTRGDELDEEFARILNNSPIHIHVRRLGEGKYYFGGRIEERPHGKFVAVGGKTVLCRLMEYSRQGANVEEDSEVSSGGSHSGVEDAIAQQKEQQASLRAPPLTVSKTLRRPEPAASRSTRPRARSYTSPSSHSSKNRKVMVRVGGGWQGLDTFLLDQSPLTKEAARQARR
ncbi:hypothetical protein BGZ46_004556 [Entomortierella lignicola]|nr:hypothetical protein BGZ46_004556 [Entomortierella lignicola]